jgi:hypothetical protein
LPDYDPHSPATVGSEWMGSRQRILPIGTGNAAGPRIHSTATESVSAITVLTRSPAGPQPLLLCDVYDLAGDINPDDEFCVAKPTACYSLGAGFQTWVGGVFGGSSDPAVTNAVDDIVGDDVPTDTGQNDALVASAHPFSARAMFFNNGVFFHGDTGASGASITGKRIKYVEIVAIMSNQTGAPITVCGNLEGHAGVGSTGIEQSAPQTIPAGAVLQRMRFRFKQNNAVGGLPWDHGNIAPWFNGTAGFGFSVLSKPGAGWFGISAIEFGVHVCTETRVAHGVGFGKAGGGDVFSSFAMLDPNDGSSQAWAKVNGHNYWVAITAVRAPSAIFGVSTYGVAGAPFAQLPTTQLETCALGTEGMGVPVSELVPDIDAMQCLLVVGGGYSVDSNVYAGVAPFVCGDDGSASLRQDMTGSGTFQIVGLLVAGDGTQDAPLTIQLKRGSSVLSSATIDPADSDAPSDGRATVVKRVLSAPITFSGGEYIQVSSTSTHGWSLPCLFTRLGADTINSVSTGAAARGIGGSADSANSDVTQDFPWWISTIPSPPSGLAATVANFTTTNASPGGPRRISYAALNWNSTALGGNFNYYEVLRNGNVIARITAEGQSLFNDFEMKRGVVNSYTVRVVRDDGAQSVESAGATVTVDSPQDCDVILTSNAAPDLTLAYQTAPGHAYGRSSSSLVQKQIIAGRVAPVVIRPLTEGNADTFQHIYTVQINDFDDVPAVFDRAVFAPLVRLVEAALPYVAVCQGNGDRWFASGTIPDGGLVFTQPGNAHRATIAWTECATLPAIVLTAAPWHP